MQLTGLHVLPASTATVWKMLMDTDTLARIVPGITSLEKTAENQYNAIADIKMGPVSGIFTGILTLKDIQEEVGYTLHVTQNSKIGNADATVAIAIKATDATHTELNFDGDAKISGVLARMGPRVIGSVANTLTKQFFENFEKELSEMKVAEPTDNQVVVEEKIAEVVHPLPVQQSFFERLLAWLKGLFL